MTDNVGLRVGIQGGEAVTAKLRQIGQEGRKAMKGIGDAADDASDSTSKIGSAMQGLALKVAAAAVAMAASFSALDKFKEANETVKRVENALTASGVPAEQLRARFEDLYQIAQRNSVPLEALTQLYGRLSQAQQSLGVSSQQILSITENVSKALRVSGQSAEASSGALLQLGQALAGGKVQAEEYNSLLDGMYPLLRAAAAGLKEAGGDVAKLTTLVKDGEVSSKAFFAAIQAGSPVLDTQLASAQKTVAQAQTELNNAMVAAAEEFSRLTGIGNGTASMLSNVAGNLVDVARQAAAATNAVIGLRNGFVAMNAARLESMQLQGGAAGAGAAIGAMASPEGRKAAADAVQARLDAEAGAAEMARETRRANAMLIANQARDTYTTGGNTAGPTRASGPAIKPVSKDDPRFKAKDDDEGGGGGGGGRGGASKERANAYEREVAAINKRRAALETERGLVGASALESERLKTAIQLETAAKEAGLPVTDAMKTQIGQLAEAYAQAKVSLDETKEIFKAQNDLMRTVGQGITGYLSDIFSGGENAQKALMNLSKRMADLALQAVLMGEGPLGKILGLQGQGGNMGGLLGALVGGLRGSFSGPSASPAGMPLNIMPGSFSSGIDRVPGDGLYRLHRGETVVPAFDSALLRPLISAAADKRPGAAGGGVVVNNYGSPEQVRTRQDSNGVTIIDVMDQTNARGASQAMRGRGPFAGMVDPRVAAHGRTG
jgi:tape measure domain-containing protein